MHLSRPNLRLKWITTPGIYEVMTYLIGLSTCTCCLFVNVTLFMTIIIFPSCRRYPNIILRRYFVFNYFEAKEGSPLLELTAKTTALDPYAMVIFPPDRECEGGSMIDVHTHEIMSNVAVKLFAALEFHILKCEEYRGKAANVVSSYKSNPHVTTASLLPSWLTLSTHYDMLENTDLDSTTSSSSTLSLAASSSVQADKVRKAKKRINGRMRKWMGDVCLQVRFVMCKTH